MGAWEAITTHDSSSGVSSLLFFMLLTFSSRSKGGRAGEATLIVGNHQAFPPANPASHCTALIFSFSASFIHRRINHQLSVCFTRTLPSILLLSLVSESPSFSSHLSRLAQIIHLIKTYLTSVQFYRIMKSASLTSVFTMMWVRRMVNGKYPDRHRLLYLRRYHLS